MKKFNKILMASIAMMTMVLSSCNKEKVFEQESNGTISVSVNGILGEYSQSNDTKAELVNTTRVKWVAGDKVYVYDGATCLGTLTVSLKDGKDYYAILGGTIGTPQAGTTKLTLVYSNKFASAPEINTDGEVKLDMAEQTGSTSANNLPFVAYATLDYTSGAPEIQDQIADFSFATSIMRLICTGLEASKAISEVTLCGMSNECVLNITKEGVAVGQGEIGDIDITLSGVNASAKGAQIIYAAVAKNETAGHQTIHVEQTKGYFYSFGVSSRGVGKSINAVCQLESREVIPAKFSVSDTKRVYFSRANLWADGPSTSRILHFEDDQHKVATSNGKWNTSHISYFSWASTLTKATSSFTSGAYDTSLFCNESNKISVDGSEAIYYALSSEEWMYLVNNRGENKFNFVSVNGKNGLVLAPDNATLDPAKLTYTEAELDDANLVFLPVGGHRRDNNNIYGPGDGFYLSSTINVPADKSFWAFNIRLNDEDHVKKVQLRSSAMDGGMLLRLVADATN